MQCTIGMGNFSMSIIAQLKITIVTIIVNMYVCAINPNKQWFKDDLLKFSCYLYFI